MSRLPVKVVAAGGGSQPIGRGIGKFGEMVVADASSSQPIPVSVAEFRAVLQRDLTPAAWFQYQIGITVTGAGVSQWDDKSGNGRHLKQGTDTNRPALQADGSVLFDGSDNFLATDAFTLNQPTSIYLLAKQVTWTLNDVLCDGNTANTGRIWQRGTTPNLGLSAGSNAGSAPLTVDTYGVIAAVFSGAASLIQINSATASTGDAGAGNMGGFTLGATANPALYANAEVKEAIVFGAAHDATTRALIRAYLAAVGGL